MEKCPICGSSGKDMVFAFYCSNKECQNFKQDEGVSQTCSDNIDDSDDYLDVYSVYGFWPYGD